MKRVETKPISDLLLDYIKEEGLKPEFARLELFNAWDEVVGERVAKHTSNKFIKDGVLFCTISSSMLRTQIYFQLENILVQMKKKVPDSRLEKIVLK